MDGKWHRAPVEGDKGRSKSGRYKGYLEGILPAGFIEHFKDPTRTGPWKSGAAMRPLSAAKRAALAREAAAAEAERDRCKAARQATIAQRCTVAWEGSPPAPADHPYLRRKGIPGDGLRIDRRGRLRVPMRDFAGIIRGLQTIAADGFKLFPRGGRVSGLHLLLGEAAPGGVLLVAEGHATAATLHAATGYAVAVAFSKVNFGTIAEVYRQRFPNLRIAFAGDNDHHLPRRDPPLPNVGKDAAEAAARDAGGVAILPEFQPHKRGTDWNDYASTHGLDAVRTAIEAAITAATHTQGASPDPLQPEPHPMPDAHVDDVAAEPPQPEPDTDAGEPEGEAPHEAKPNGHDGPADADGGDQEPPLTEEEAAEAEAKLQKIVERAASMKEAAYIAARTRLAAGPPKIGVGHLDKLRRAERARRTAEGRTQHDAMSDDAALDDAPPSPYGGAVKWPPGYTMKKDGLHYTTDEGSARLAGPFAVLGRARDGGSNGWSVALQWLDDDGEKHRALVSAEMIHGSKGTLEATLYDGGLFVSPDFSDGCSLRDGLSGLKTKARVARVSRCGWHHPAEAGAAPFYMLADDSVISATCNPAMLDNASPDAAKRCATAGTLKEWQETVARYAAGNDVAAFAIAAAFAAPLLDVAGEPSGGFHVAGPSKIGKTTALQMGASVSGPPTKRGALRDWNSTGNAMEAVFAAGCDGLVALDELAEADARNVEALIYQMGNEGGKARLRADASARESRTWRVMLLSSGEGSPAQRVSELGKKMHAGAEMRLPSIGLPKDPAAVWLNLHSKADRDGLWTALHKGLAHAYGTAGREFLAQLAKVRATNDAKLRERVNENRKAFLKMHLPADATDQARTVARRFALVAEAGEMATNMGVLPWPKGEATRATAAMLALWRADHGTGETSEDAAGVRQVRAFIERHGEARFALVEDGQGNQVDDADCYPVRNRYPVQNRAGWRVPPKGDEGWQYLILPEAWRDEVCKGLNPANVATALRRAGHFSGGDGKNLAANKWIPSEKAIRRVYVVRGSILY